MTKSPGEKIEERNLKSMKGSALFLLCFLGWGLLSGAPQSNESLAVQEFRLNLQQMGSKVSHCKSEIDLFQERLSTLERGLQEFQGDLKLSKSDRLYEKRIAALEKTQEAITSDLKTLKGHVNETSSMLSSCQTKLDQIDEQLSSDIKNLKQSLSSMLALLKKEEEKSYVVKSGDSLGQIALDHKTSTNTLKNLNNLNSDTIYPGQKLIIP